MMPGYDRARTRFGDGSHHLRCDDLQNQVQELNIIPSRFEDIIHKYAEGFASIPSEIEKVLGLSKDNFSRSLKLWFKHGDGRSDSDVRRAAEMEEAKKIFLAHVVSAKESFEQVSASQFNVCLAITSA